ncbi:MAG TPA: YfhO family protein [Saprospiraceae bacterium]|nr:YfhO family protein [Saprospiraceae bacterium]
MKNKIYGGKLIQPLMAAGVFLLLSVMYFLPQLQGKVIQQTDILAVRAMNHEAQVYQEKTGRVQLWTNSMFGGMPTYQMSMPQKHNLVKYIDKIHQAFISRPIGYFFAAMLGCYIVLLCLGSGHWAAMLGAIAFGLTTNGMTLYETGHMSKFMTLVYSAYLFGGVILAYQKKYIAGGVLFAVGMGLSLYNNHIQMTYYLGLFLILYVVAAFIFAIRQKEIPAFIRGSAILAIGLILALGASASKMWTTYEYSKDTMRGKPVLETPLNADPGDPDKKGGLDWDYAMQWSNGVKDVIAIFIPRGAGGSGSEYLSANSATVKDLKSKGVDPTFGMPLYFGSLPFTSGPAYVGASVLFLFIFGLFYLRRSLKWWLVLAVALTILMSMGKHFAILNHPLFDYLPMYSKFRAPSSILSITALLIPLGAALGLGAFMRSNDKNFKRPMYIALGITGGACLLIALFGTSFMSFNGANDARYASSGWNIDALIKDRKSALSADAWRSLIWVALCGAVIWVYCQGKIKQWLLLSALGLIIVADLWPIGRRYISAEDFVPEKQLESVFNPRQVDDLILKDPDLYYRVHDVTEDYRNSSMASYFHHTIGGYSPAKMQRYEDLLNRYISKGNLNVLNMLNAKYFIVPGQDKKPVVQQNPNAMGNAWFVDAIQIVNSNNEELAALDSARLDSIAFVNKEFASYVQGFDPVKGGSIKLTSYEPDELVYQASAPSEQLAVFSDIYYGPNKGWQAFVDGKKVDHLRADYTLRAMRIPQGDHEIRFKFQPRSYSVGETISMICSFLVVLLLGYGVWSWLTTPMPLTPATVPDPGSTRHPQEKRGIKPKKRNKP